MLGFKSIISTSAAVFVAASVLTAPVAVADTDVAPNMWMSVSTGGNTTVFDPANYGSVNYLGNSIFGYQGQKNVQNAFGLGWSMMVNPDPFIIANLVVTNNTLATQSYSVTVSLPIGFQDVFYWLAGGSVTGTVTDLNGNGATLSTTGGLPIYTASVGATTIATLLDDPSSTSVGAFQSGTLGPALFGGPQIPSLQVDPSLFPNPMQITLNFELSAGDSASFTSIFVLEKGPDVPAPGALVLLGMVGLVGARRRRG